MYILRTTACLFIAFWFALTIQSQNATVTKQLKLKYSIVEYHKDHGGWYLVGKQTGTEKQYGFCDKMGRVIVFGGTEYKLYGSFLELYMPDPKLQKEYNEWKVKHDEWYKEYVVYERAKKAYDSKCEIISRQLSEEEQKRREEEFEKKKELILKKYTGNNLKALESEIYQLSLEYHSKLPSFSWSEAEAALLKQGIEKPTIREEPEKPGDGCKWVAYTYIQPQPYQEIDFSALKEGGGILCSVKKNGLYGLADKNLKPVVPCTYKEPVKTSSAMLDGTCQKFQVDGKYGVVNSSGKVILKGEYKDIGTTSNGFLKVTKDGNLYGLYDADGNEVLPVLFTDVSFATGAEQPFSVFAQHYVEQFVNEWQKKGEFEKTAVWQARVNEQTRRQKIMELTEKAQKAYLGLYCNGIKDDFILGKYDPDHETFLIESKIGGKLLVPVPIAKAEAFKSRFADCVKKPVYFIQNDGIGIAKCEFRLSDSEVYAFSNQASLNYSIAQVEYNFDPITINPGETDGGQGKQTISTLSLNVGKSDVDTDIPVVTATNDKTFAVIISNENYQNEKRVDYANNDGWIFKEYCHKTLGIPAKNIHYKADATFNNIRHELNWIRQVAEAYNGEANVIVYFAGHGVPDENSHEAFLLPVDGISSDVSTGISLNALYKSLGELSVNKVFVFLDACFSGALRGNGMLASARGVAIKSKADEPQGKMVVFSAATGQETAYPYKEKGHGMFTYFMLKKLKESKGDVTLDELSDFVVTNVKQQSIVVNGKSQTPTVAASLTLTDSWKELKLR